MKPRSLKMHGSMRLTVAEANALLAWAAPELEEDKAKRAALARAVDKLQRAIKAAHKPFKGHVSPALAEQRTARSKVAAAVRRDPASPLKFPGGAAHDVLGHEGFGKRGRE